MIPDFNDDGLLPKGVHWATLDEIRDKLGFSNRRMKLIIGLERAIRSFQAANCNTMYLDGSFVTSKIEPSDIDVCYDFIGMDPTKLDPILLDFKNERAAQKNKYGCEFFMSHWGAILNPPINYFDFFQRDKTTGNQKGIIGLKL